MNLPDTAPPLAGIRVVDLSQNLPGPFATLTLAALGAEVIKVEPPGGDSARMTPRLFAIVNAGKRSVVLDLKHEDGRARLRTLVASADVLVEGFRPGVMERFGFAPETTLRAHPRLVYCSISGYGDAGPYRDHPGHDLNFQALTGVCHMSRDADDHPLGSALPIADLSSAQTAVAAILAALVGRARDGVGRRVDVAMIDTLAAWTHAWAEGLTPSDTRASDLLGHAERWLAGSDRLPMPIQPLAARVAHWLGDARVRRRSDAIGARLARTEVVQRLVRLRLHALPHYGVFRTRDDRWLSVAIVDEDKFWRALCQGLGLSRMGGLPLAVRMLGAAPLRRMVAAAIRRRELDHWLVQLDRHAIPVAPVLTVAEALADPQVLARFAGRPGAPAPLAQRRLAPAPALGEHTAAVFAQLDA